MRAIVITGPRWQAKYGFVEIVHVQAPAVGELPAVAGPCVWQ